VYERLVFQTANGKHTPGGKALLSELDAVPNRRALQLQIGQVNSIWTSELFGRAVGLSNSTHQINLTSGFFCAGNKTEEGSC
jgi:hypothetical protein